LKFHAVDLAAKEHEMANKTSGISMLVQNFRQKARPLFQVNGPS
jgi:hypothetical protein